MNAYEYSQYKKMLTRGQFAEAARFAELAYLEGHRNNPFWLTRQAAALTRTGQYGQALAIANKALALQPENPFAVLAAAEALTGLRRHREALEHYESITIDGEHKVSTSARRGMLECLTELKSWDRILELIAIWDLPPDGFAV